MENKFQKLVEEQLLEAKMPSKALNKLTAKDLIGMTKNTEYDHDALNIVESRYLGWSHREEHHLYAAIVDDNKYQIRDKGKVDKGTLFALFIYTKVHKNGLIAAHRGGTNKGPFKDLDKAQKAYNKLKLGQ